MLKCTSVRENLSRFLDNDCDADEAADIAEHVAICLTCQQELAELRSVQSLLHRLPAPPDGDDARERIFARLERTVRLEEAAGHRIPSGRRWWLPRLAPRPAMATLAAATVAAGLFLLVPQRDAAPAVAVSLPGPDEMTTLFHLHDAHSAGLNADDPLLHRDTAAEARAALLGDADAAVAGSL